MENSINILHPIDTIKSSYDGKLFQKIDEKWVETNNILYKSEYKYPTNDVGNDGDFYAKYYRKYNYILYFYSDLPKNKIILPKKGVRKVYETPSKYFDINMKTKDRKKMIIKEN